MNEVHYLILVAHSFHKINPKPFKQKIATNFLVAIFCVQIKLLTTSPLSKLLDNDSYLKTISMPTESQGLWRMIAHEYLFEGNNVQLFLVPKPS